MYIVKSSPDHQRLFVNKTIKFAVRKRETEEEIKGFDGDGQVGEGLNTYKVRS